MPPPAVVPWARPTRAPARDPYAAARRRHRPPHRRHRARRPLGGAPEATRACGHCLAVRWQRLRTRSERDALETGTGTRQVGRWPLLPAWLPDAVWAVYEAVVLAPDPPASPAPTAADRALPQVTRVDLATLRTHTFPLLAEPLCPSCAAQPGPEEPEPELRPASRPKPDPGTYRLRPAAAHPLPTAALANPSAARSAPRPGSTSPRPPPPRSRAPSSSAATRA
ncbi:TOMM precursor leader peptide-binding protein [Streptomyces sp. M19]